MTAQTHTHSTDALAAKHIENSTSSNIYATGVLSSGKSITTNTNTRTAHNHFHEANFFYIFFSLESFPGYGDTVNT